jgi:hypothetical protein
VVDGSADDYCVLRCNYRLPNATGQMSCTLVEDAYLVAVDLLPYKCYSKRGPGGVTYCSETCSVDAFDEVCVC